MGNAAGRPVVWLALSETGGPYAEAAEAARAELQRGGGADVTVAPWRQLLDQAEPAPRLVVAVGVAAMRGMEESGRVYPVIAALVPRAAYLAAASHAQPGRPQSGVWLDQPVGRQLDALHLAMPARLRVGALLGSEAPVLEGELQRAAAERGLAFVAGRVEGIGQLPAVLQRVLDDADVLLALPDPQIYNGATIQNVLTSAYRRRVPMAGFSPAYVKAGALLSVYSTPAQVGTLAGEIARNVLAGRPMPPAQGPRDFTIAINPDVARSLGIPIDAGAVEKWVEHIRAKERAP